MTEDRIRLAVASPKIRLCDPESNARTLVEAAELAAGEGADIIVFPELALTGATCADLYYQKSLTDAAEAALSYYIEKTKELSILSFVGLPVRRQHVSGEVYIYNAVAAVSCGEIIGISASSDIRSPYFTPVLSGRIEMNLCSRAVTLGADFVYGEGEEDAEDDATRVKIQVKIGKDDIFVDSRVNLIINPTAAPEYIGLADERRREACNLSARYGCAIAYCGAGTGESGTDGVYAAPRLVCECGECVAEAELFSEEILYAELTPSAATTAPEHIAPDNEPKRSPFIPDGDGRDGELALAIQLQARGLASRIERSYSRTAVIGVSGGLDSTAALIAAAGAMDILGKSRSDIIAITMPCFGTTARTKSNALALASLLGCTVRTIDIKAAVEQHFMDISHPSDKYDVVYENSQARERTQILMDVANAEGGLVVGTGDLSELALGFATYNGDHMSMYCVNSSVPKTLMREMIDFAARMAKSAGQSELSEVLLDVIKTPVSPELLPLDSESDAENKQHTEVIVGPYELHDFFLYNTVKYGYSTEQILELSIELFPEYEPSELRGYYGIFLRRFFSQQFKRSCMPDGPRVTEISLSPRGAWRMPSDCSSAAFLKNIIEK